MIATLLLAAAAAPWAHPLAFAPLRGWERGRSGNTRSAYVGTPTRAPVPLESTAWAARGVRYRDDATADPPNRTLARLPRGSVIVWAVVYSPPARGQQPIRLRLAGARMLPCCEAAFVRGGIWELAGTGPRRAYSVIVRVYFGSHPTKALRTQAQRALDALELPASR